MESTQRATLGGGCFWCLDAIFRALGGVQTVESGYAGGNRPNPSYEDVCSGNTGHAEVIHITYDPQQITFNALLEAFFAIHDPTTLNRQGHDVGTQYRSIILYHSPEQETIVRTMIQNLDNENRWPSHIVTEVAPFTVFYPAETEHQDFWTNHPYHPYCQRIIAPKVASFLKNIS